MERKFKIGDHDYIYNSSYGTELDRAFKKVDDLTKSCTFIIGDHDYIYNSSYGTELDRAFKKVDDLTKSCTFINGVAYIPLHIENVIFNNPATIVFWSDGSKTVVKCKDEAFDEEKGLAMAISKKVLGNKGSYFNEFKKWLPTIEACEDKEE